jgi:fructokinase
MGGVARRDPLVVCWGELLWDRFGTRRRLGGAPANAAYHAAALGNRSALVSRVGRDALGDEAIVSLRRRGVNTRWIQRDALPTGVVDVELSSGEPRYSIASPSAWDRIACDAHVEELLPRADAFCFGTLGQRVGPDARAQLERAIARLPSACLRVCDVNARRPFDDSPTARAAIELANVVKLNASEAERLGTDWIRAGVVAITRGAAGSEIRAGGERYVAAGVPIDSARGDRVGAGDAFTAALIHGLLRDVGPKAANERANRYAAYVATQRGAMPPIPPRVRDAVTRGAP